MKNRPRKLWISILFTFLSIGLGHIYAGYAKRGIVLYISQYLLVFICYLILLNFLSIASLIVILILGLMYFVFCLVDVIKLTKENTVSYESKKYNRWYVYVLLLLVIFLIPQPIFSETVKNNIFQAYKIPADSMKPTLLIGDRIFVKTDFASKSNVKRFDLIVFPFTQNPSKDFVKRIIAVEGETIEIKNKKILINDIPIKETYGIHTDSRIIPKRDNMNSIKVPEGSLFVMGDNRDNSHDSRFWGFVKASDVIGKVYSVYWSWDKEKNEVRWNRIGQIIK